MEREAVSSSNIDSIGYDPDTEMLEIEFRGGTVYEYRNVPLVVYEELMNAASHGSYFNREISKRYSYEKIE